MNNQHKPTGAGGDIRSFLKSQHRRVYSICRLFTDNYKEQQALFANMLSAVSHCMMGVKEKRGKDSLLLTACMNMAALHSIDLELAERSRHAKAEGASHAWAGRIRHIHFDFENAQFSTTEHAQSGRNGNTLSGRGGNATHGTGIATTDREIQFKSPEFQHSMEKFRNAVGEISDGEKFNLFGQLENISSEDIRDLIGLDHVKTTTHREWSWTSRNFIPYIKQKLVWN